MNQNVDLSPALMQLLTSCHTFCSVDCCRADAFEISEGIIARWLDLDRVDRTGEIAAEIEQIKGVLDQSEGEIILAARGLESTWPNEEFQTFWDRLESAFSSALAWHRKTVDIPPN
jgi:hypothetical protein